VGYVSVSYKTVSHQMCLHPPLQMGAFRHSLVISVLTVVFLIGTVGAEAFDFVSIGPSRYAFTLQTPSIPIEGLQLIPPRNKAYKGHIHITVVNGGLGLSGNGGRNLSGVNITIKDTDGHTLASGTNLRVNDSVELNFNAPRADGNVSLEGGKGVMVDISGNSTVIYS
jgi:hypothetical protein